jgi:hypothetical protein
MAYMHSFDAWHTVISGLTEQAIKQPESQYYVLYSLMNKPCYLLLERQEQVNEMLLESLDNGRTIYRVGETKQLTERMFIWPNSLPRHVVWAVVPRRGKRFANEPATSPLLKFYEWDRLYLAKASNGTTTIQYLLQDSYCQLGLEDRLNLTSPESDYPAGINKTDVAWAIMHRMSEQGAIEHRWFGRVAEHHTVFGNLFAVRNDPTYKLFELHDVMLGDTELDRKEGVKK